MLFKALQILSHFLVIQITHRPLIGFWIKALTNQYLTPTVVPEQLTIAQKNHAAFAEEIDAVTQRIRHRHGAHVIPKLGIVSARGMIVKNNKIPRAFRLFPGLTVILIDDRS